MDPPSKFDVVIGGTSLVNCILAAALCKSGVSVLHLDPNEFYGEEEGTHELSGFVSSLEKSASSPVGFVRSVEASPTCKTHQHARRFAIDGTPKGLLSCGPLVDLLVRSGVSRYLEFKSLQNAYMQLEQGTPIKVPCSKSDVFQSTVISLVEKRFLMKFLGSIQDPVLPTDWASKSFPQVLGEHKLDGVLRAVVVHAICGVNSIEEMSATDGAALVKRYLGSVGRFGPSPFIFPLYGGSESSQAFSRLAAVNGGTYMLRKGVKSVAKEDELHVVVDSEGEVWRAQHVVLSPNNCAESDRVGPVVFRACVAVKNHPFGVATATHVINGHVVHSLILDSGMKVAPDGFSLVYFWSQADVLGSLVNGLADVEWKVLWTTQAREGKSPLDSVLVTHDPDQLDLDFSACIQEAERLFVKLAPEGSVFFPPQQENKDEDNQ